MQSTPKKAACPTAPPMPLKMGVGTIKKIDFEGPSGESQPTPLPTDVSFREKQKYWFRMETTSIGKNVGLTLN